jgi:hypothetical protein|tara:strand:- start:31 stop:345 length:315 start_codon:yes stop_codon:yes gene_type:complete
MKKPNKKRLQKNLLRGRKKASKELEKKRASKIRRKGKLTKKIKERQANKETFIMEDEIRRIQAQGIRDAKRMSREAAEKAVEITEEEYNQAKENLENCQEETKA